MAHREWIRSAIWTVLAFFLLIPDLSTGSGFSIKFIVVSGSLIKSTVLNCGYFCPRNWFCFVSCARKWKQVAAQDLVLRTHLTVCLPVTPINQTLIITWYVSGIAVDLVNITTNNVHFLPPKSFGVSSKVALEGMQIWNWWSDRKW